MNASLEAYRFDEAAHALYQFFWSEFCDGYVEMIKPVLRGADVPEAEKAKTRGVLKRVLLDSLALLHPFMPFVSCEIREALNGDGLRLAIAKFPEPQAAWKDDEAVEAVEALQGRRHARPESARGARPRADRGARHRPRAPGWTPFKGIAASRSAPQPSRAAKRRGDFFESELARSASATSSRTRAGRGAAEERDFF